MLCSWIVNTNAIRMSHVAFTGVSMLHSNAK